MSRRSPSLRRILAQWMLQCKVAERRKDERFQRGVGRLKSGRRGSWPSSWRGARKANRRPRGTADLSYWCQRGLAGRTCVLEGGPEQFPAFAVELHHLQLLVDAVIVGPG